MVTMVDTATTHLALVPLRNDSILRNTNSKHGFIQIMPDASESMMIIGRQELVPCVYAGCGCDSNIGSTQNKCQECQDQTTWASKALSREMLRFTSSEFSVRGQFATVTIDSANEPINNVSTNDDGWTGNEPFHEGTKITFKPKKGSGILEFLIVSIDQLTKMIVPPRSNLQGLQPTPTQEDQESCGEPPSQSMMETQVPYRPPPATTPVDDDIPSFSAKTPRVKNTFKEKNEEVTVINEAHHPQPSQSTSQPDEEACAVVSHAHQDPPGVSGSEMLSQQEDPPGLSPFKPLEMKKDMVTPPTGLDIDTTNHAGSPAPAHDDLSEMKKDMVTPPTGLDADTTSNVGSPAPAHDDLARKGGNDETHSTPTKELSFRLFFCPLGQDLPQARIDFLSKTAEEGGAKIVDDFHDATHLIISNQVCALEQVAKRLGLKEDKLVLHLDSKQVQCVDPKWIVKSVGKILERPGRMDHWSGYKYNKRKITQGCRSARKQKRLQLGSRNQVLSEMFDKMSKLHQSCPLLRDDNWKAYSFNVTAGRLRNIDFDIVDDPIVMKKLRGVKGIGASSVGKIQEYFNTGSMERIKEFEIDPKRVAMKKMMDIWGVGRVKASKLVNDGYTNIDQVLRDVKIGEVELDRNQLVGVECYEDILEKMGVEEVEKIGAIICDTVKKLYPSAEARIMGSYRRGKESCGDVDIHVTHPEYEKQVPEEALGKIVDTLWREEHISFHLTYLPGMETGYGYESDHKSSRYVPEKAWENTSKEKASPRGKAREGHSSSSSYMGVFNSPTETNKRRRVDIKFYPYRERIFAALYFTGNGHFNRSMRLLAARKFDFTLNDHGLFKRGTQDRVMEEASHEKEVFDKLGIQYREPEDRDCFDAVVPKAGSKSDLEMDQTELRKDNEHVWVD